MKYLTFAILLAVATGCASIPDDFTFNGESAQSIQTDINYLLKTLPEKKKQEFVLALLAIQFSDVRSVYDMLGDPAMRGMNYDILRKKLDGLNYEQALELASKSKTKVGITAH